MSELKSDQTSTFFYLQQEHSMQAINIEDLRSRARRRLPKVIFEFIDGGAQDETTLRANREDFQKWRFRTRVLTDVSRRDQSITLFGQRCASPLILAPTGLAGLLSRRGELAAARAAEKYAVPYCLSTMATCSIEEITTETTQPKWFQLYVLRDRGLTKEFIERARASRCAALVLTVDTKMQGPRELHHRDDPRLRPPFLLAPRRGTGSAHRLQEFRGHHGRRHRRGHHHRVHRRPVRPDGELARRRVVQVGVGRPGPAQRRT
jgi:hypothetical protein